MKMKCLDTLQMQREKRDSLRSHTQYFINLSINIVYLTFKCCKEKVVKKKFQ